MPHVKVYIHFVWSTKKGEPILKTKELRKKVWQHIRQNAKEKGIFNILLFQFQSQSWTKSGIILRIRRNIIQKKHMMKSMKSS